MNISANIHAAIVASGIKGGQRTPGKPSAQSGVEAPAEPADFAEKVAFSSRAAQQESGAAASAPGVFTAGTAEAEVGYLRNVIIALPALVLGAQANLAQETGLKLL
jgi:hypothetical protein